MNATQIGDQVQAIARDHVGHDIANRLGDFAEAMNAVGHTIPQITAVLSQYLVNTGNASEEQVNSFAASLLVRLP